MYHKNPLIIFCLVVCFSLLTSCTKTAYVAHVAKQIPFPTDTPKTVGYYKVGSSYTIKNRRYYPAETFSHTETGKASWYGPGFHGKMTANGEVFNKNDLTAAHRTLQMPSIIRVTNLKNGRSVILRVNDRGPFAHNRVLDVSERAASLLGFKKDGIATIRLEVLPAESKYVAEAAKQGRDTRGYEVALNQNKVPQIHSSSNVNQPYAGITPPSKPEQITQVQISDINAPTPRPMPVERQALDQKVIIPSNAPPIPQSLQGRVYVQAGAFASEQNALNYSNQLSRIASSKVYRTQLNNAPLFRVRLGPFENRALANATIEQLNDNGNTNAVIVID